MSGFTTPIDANPLIITNENVKFIKILNLFLDCNY